MERKKRTGRNVLNVNQQYQEWRLKGAADDAVGHGALGPEVAEAHDEPGPRRRRGLGVEGRRVGPDHHALDGPRNFFLLP